MTTGKTDDSDMADWDWTSESVPDNRHAAVKHLTLLTFGVLLDCDLKNKTFLILSTVKKVWKTLL